MRITFDHISFAYPSGTFQHRKLFSDLCLEFDSQDLIGICGMTGSGKSTFIRHVNGILTPDAGKILIDGEDIHRSKARLQHIRQRIGMTFQFPERQLFGRTVWEELSYTLERRHIPEPEIHQRIFAACERLHFDIQAFRDHSPFSLSRGDQRKLGILTILTLQPEVFVLDEPTAGMDLTNAYQLLDQLKAIHQEQGMGVILVSHDIRLLLKYVDALIIINEGQIVFSGTPQELLLSSDQVQHIGLPLPPMIRVLQTLRRHYPQIPTNITSVHDAVEQIVRHVSMSK